MTRILTALIAVAATFCVNAEVWQAEYGVARVFNFKLYNADGTLDVDEADGGTEVSLSCNEGAETTATNDFADEGNFYSISLTAAELQCERVAIVVAATTTEVFFVETFGHASGFNETLGWLTGDAFARIGAAGAGLTAIDLPNQTMDITGTLSTVTTVTNGVNTTSISGDSTAADNLEAFLDLIVNQGNGAFPPYGISASGTAQSYTAGTPEIVLAASTAAADNDFNDHTISAWGDAGELHSQCVSDYTGASDAVLLDAAFNTAPTGTIRYVIWATPGCSQGGTAQTGDAYAYLTSNLGALGANATAVDDSVMTRLGAPAGASVSGDIAAIEGQTDDIGVAGAGLTAADDAVLTRLGTPAGADVSTDIAAIEAQTDDIGVAGAGLTAADDALITAIAALNDIAASDVRDIIIEDQGGGVTLGCFAAVLLAYAAGDLSTAGGNSTYEDPSGTETRATGTVASAGNRTAAITCPTY